MGALGALYVRGPGADGPPLRLSELCDVQVVSGPFMLRSEAGRLAGYVYVDVLPSRDLDPYVNEAKGSGADAMKRIAAPLVGDLFSSAFLTLELIRLPTRIGDTPS